MARSYRFPADHAATLAAHPGAATATITTEGETVRVDFADDDWHAFDGALPAAPLEAGPDLAPLTVSVSAEAIETLRDATTLLDLQAARDALVGDADARMSAGRSR